MPFLFAFISSLSLQYYLLQMRWCWVFVDMGTMNRLPTHKECTMRTAYEQTNKHPSNGLQIFLI